MSQSGALRTTGSGAPPIETLTGNSGGAVSPDAAFNINILGNNTTGINVVGMPASNTLSIVGIQATTTQRGTVELATDAEAIAGTDTANALTSSNLSAKLGAQTANGLPIGAGSNAALVWTANPTDGQLLIGSTGLVPTLGNITSTGGTITVTNGPGTINLDLSGGGLAIDQIAVDASTAPGTNPVLPAGSGQVTITGAQVATGTIGANVIRTDSLAANSLTIEIQRTTSAAATDSTLNGVSHFDSARFTVDANGFVSLNGSGVAQTITGDSGGALSPTAGNWNILGGPGVTTSGSGSTLTINSVVFTDQGGSTSVTSDSGSFATAAITLTTPGTPAQGEELVFVCTSASALVIDAASTHLIRIGSLVSSAGGTATSTAIGDSLTLRYRSSDTTWYAVSAIGTWVLA